MNWYSVFYWLTVADNVNLFLKWIVGIFSVGTVAFMLVYFMCYVDNSKEAPKKFHHWWRLFFFLSILSWGGFVFVPDKKDCLLIIAGGSVGNFITSDSSSLAIPSDVTKYLHESLQNEIKDLNQDVKKELGVQTPKEKLMDKVKDLTREQIIEALQNDTTLLK